MLSAYFDEMVGILAAWDNNQRTQQQYQMAMLYGLNNATDGSPEQQISLNSFYNQTKAKYNIDDATLNSFYNSQLNSTSNKLPTSGCN